MLFVENGVHLFRESASLQFAMHSNRVGGKSSY